MPGGAKTGSKATLSLVPLLKEPVRLREEALNMSSDEPAARKFSEGGRGGGREEGQ